MILVLKVEVPASADASATFAKLWVAAKRRQGVTVVTADRLNVDVDLIAVDIGEREAS